jgi:hypothetical protein
VSRGSRAQLTRTTLRPDAASALDENVQAIKRWERGILLARSKAEQVSDWIACTAGSRPVLLLHVVWFGALPRGRFPGADRLGQPGSLGRLTSLVISISKFDLRHLDVETTVSSEQLRDLIKKIGLRRLTGRMEELAWRLPTRQVRLRAPERPPRRCEIGGTARLSICIRYSRAPNGISLVD